MDVGSPEHLERLRSQPEIKAAILRLLAHPLAGEARFERAPKNTGYWPPIAELDARFLAAGQPDNVREPHTIYNRPCWLLSITLGSQPDSPYIIAIAAADGAPSEELLKLLRDVCHDYWYGSYFWK